MARFIKIELHDGTAGLVNIDNITDIQPAQSSGGAAINFVGDCERSLWVRPSMAEVEEMLAGRGVLL